MIDADGHVIESARELESFGWRGTTTGNPSMDALLARDPATMPRAICPAARPFSAETRLADMEAEGIEVSVNYPTAMLLLNQIPSVAVANELSRAYNSWACETFTVPSSGRVLTMALVNITDATSAVNEARRAITELGAPGIMVPPYAGPVHLDDPSLDPLWALAEELDAPVGVHGGRGTTDPVLAAGGFRDSKRYYAMAHPVGQMVAMGDLVIGGVLKNFPRLRVGFLESGIGWVRWYVDRLDEAAESVDNNGVPWGYLEMRPSSYLLTGNCYFTCEPDEPGLEDLVVALGRERVLFSSDYPHFDCSFPHTTKIIATSVADPALLRQITRDNAREFYRQLRI